MESTFLQSSGKLLVLLHAACAIVLVGAVSHHALVALGYLRGVYRLTLGRVYAASVAGSYALTYLIGGLVYPTYRYHVRELVLDRQAVWASNLFDIKENLAALGLPLALSVLLLSRRLRPDQEKELVGPYFALVCGVWLLSWFPAIAGLIITMQRGVPA